jgi:glycosyltransferase involved in cell wall biosynthesis
MKILSVSHSCVVGEYRKRMAEVGPHPNVELTVLAPKHWFQFNKRIELEEDVGSDYELLAVQPITWGFRKNGMRNATHIYRGLPGILKRVRPDIVELWEEPFSAVTAHAILHARRIVPKAKIIFFSAQNILRRYPFPFSAFERYTYDNSDYAFLMNDDVGSIVRAKGYNREFLVLPLGVDPELFCKKDVFALKEELGLRDFVIGFIGKISKQKGILDLIEGVSKVNGKIQLLIIGNGELRSEAEHLATVLNLRKRTIIIDAVPHLHVPDYLNCMDVFVLPSITLPRLKEQFGRVLIEAMACQVPVIGSNSGEIPRTIGEAGFIFKEGNIIDLKGKIEALLKDRNLRVLLGENGRKRVLENFTWKAIAEKQYQAYIRLMSNDTCAT